MQISCRDLHVPPQPERVVLIDPCVVAGFRTVLADAFEPGSGILVEGPALGAVIACRLRPSQRCFALAAIETAEMSAGERDPHDAVAVDVRAARAEAWRRDVE